MFFVIERQGSPDQYSHSRNKTTEAEKGKGDLAKLQNQLVRDLSLEPCFLKPRLVPAGAPHAGCFSLCR